MTLSGIDGFDDIALMEPSRARDVPFSLADVFTYGLADETQEKLSLFLDMRTFCLGSTKIAYQNLPEHDNRLYEKVCSSREPNSIPLVLTLLLNSFVNETSPDYVWRRGSAEAQMSVRCNFFPLPSDPARADQFLKDLESTCPGGDIRGAKVTIQTLKDGNSEREILYFDLIRYFHALKSSSKFQFNYNPTILVFIHRSLDIPKICAR